MEKILSPLVLPVLDMLIFCGAYVMLFFFSRALCYIGSRLPLSVSYSLGCLTTGRGEGPICRDSLQHHNNNLLVRLAPPHQPVTAKLFQRPRITVKVEAKMSATACVVSDFIPLPVVSSDYKSGWREPCYVSYGGCGFQ